MVSVTPLTVCDPSWPSPTSGHPPIQPTPAPCSLACPSSSSLPGSLPCPTPHIPGHSLPPTTLLCPLLPC